MDATMVARWVSKKVQWRVFYWALLMVVSWVYLLAAPMAERMDGKRVVLPADESAGMWVELKGQLMAVLKADWRVDWWVVHSVELSVDRMALMSVEM